MSLYFIEFEIDQPGPPLSWFAHGTQEEADALQEFLEKQLEDWQNPVVALAETERTISDLITEFYNDWGVGNEEDAPVDFLEGVKRDIDSTAHPDSEWARERREGLR